MNETITLAEIAKIIDVPKEKVREQFNRGMLLEFVPRPQNSDAKWVIYRKDFEVAMARKERQIVEESKTWDSLFTLDALALD